MTSARPLPAPVPGDCPHQFVADHDHVRCQEARINAAISRTRNNALFDLTKAETLWVLDYVRARVEGSVDG